MRNTPARARASRRLFPPAITALAVALSALLPGCAQFHATVQDLVHGWDTCQPVSPACFEDQSEFYAVPTIAALQTWNGREVAELLAAWGRPARVEPLGGGNYRYVWSETKTIGGEVSYQHDMWSNKPDWDLVRSPDQTFECLTYMQVDQSRRVTPQWVNRLGMCSQYFPPRVPAAPLSGGIRTCGVGPGSPECRSGGGPGSAGGSSPAPPAEEPSVPLEPPRQIREQQGY
jgi:hypothetical protein